MTCKGICTNYKAKKSGGLRYFVGQKYCTSCSIFIEWNDICCPCCKQKLRSKPRRKSHKANLVKYKIQNAMSLN